jgi:hypothetical protein
MKPAPPVIRKFSALSAISDLQRMHHQKARQVPEDKNFDNSLSRGKNAEES